MFQDINRIFIDAATTLLLLLHCGKKSERETRDIINNPYYYIKGGRERGKRHRKEGLITRKDEAAIQLFFS